MGHARAILGSKSAEQQLQLYQRILKEGLSVRKVEELVQEDSQSKPAAAPRKTAPYPEQQKALSLLLNRRVRIQDSKIVIPFENEDDLAQLLSRIS